MVEGKMEGIRRTVKGGEFDSATASMGGFSV